MIDDIKHAAILLAFGVVLAQAVVLLAALGIGGAG